jgi:predicted AlkP superfamily phosphohydrolase/phosphomutase
MKPLAFASLAFLLTSCTHPAPQKRVIVIGVDGMDPNFLERHWASLPNLARLRNAGGLTRLATTTPPQSPVAWATFITGTDPAQHGLFDFVHRDPDTLQPISSMGETLEPAHQLRVGPYLLPLSKARVRTFRQGEPFWRLLAEHGIPVTVMRMPTNYPPDHEAEALSGMGTPDLEGTFGTFTYYTDDPAEQDAEVSGGRIIHVDRAQDRVQLPVAGPANTLRADHRPTSLEMTVDIDPAEPIARFRIDGQQFILRQGEWSSWIHVRYPLVPHLAGVSGMFRIYAAELQPGFRIYRSPLNADPANPSLPLSTPASFSRDLANHAGPFYTQGIEEDTSALRQGALNLPEYLEQSRLVSASHRKLLHDCLDRFKSGFLFFYFSEVDQNSHVLWGRHEPELLATYQTVDRAIGEVLERAAGATVIVMSDHGFAAFDYAVNLNTWLNQNGFGGKAYAMGLNALYVKPGPSHDAVLADLTRKLRAWKPVIADVGSPGPSTSRYEPDLIVGYAPPYRASWETALGGAPDADVIVPNTDAWIGDHCMSAAAVPGSLLGTRAPRIGNPSLKDLPVTILKEFGIAPDPHMTGRAIY